MPISNTILDVLSANLTLELLPACPSLGQDNTLRKYRLAGASNNHLFCILGHAVRTPKKRPPVQSSTLALISHRLAEEE